MAEKNLYKFFVRKIIFFLKWQEKIFTNFFFFFFLIIIINIKNFFRL
jgi:hypothetical protein